MTIAELRISSRSRAAIAVLACLGGIWAPAVADMATVESAADGAWAAELIRESEDLVAGREIWPGFTPRSVPVLVFDGDATYLFRYPSPPDGFTPVTVAGIPAHRWAGRHPLVVANSTAELDGRQVVTLLFGTADSSSLAGRASVLIHESFHAFQRTHHPAWSENVGDLMTYPTADAELLALRREETACLGRALLAAPGGDRAAWALQALDARTERFALLGENYIAFERLAELNEGLAAYVQYLALGEDLARVPTDGYAASAVRLRTYDTGRIFAQLLDEFRPGWRAVLDAEDTRHLDGMLAEALAGGGWPSVSLPSSAMERIRSRASADVAAELQARREMRREFDEQEGWSLVIQAAVEQPLWPNGFDPMNVQLVDGGLLHTRFLKLGNGTCTLEVMGGRALTMKAGEHPLFQGIRQVEVAGLAIEPVLHTEGDRTRLEAPGVEIVATGANVENRDRQIIVTLGGS